MPLHRIALACLAAVVASGCHEVHFEPKQQAGEITIYDNLFSVSVIDEQRAVAGGYWGAVYRTEDAGQTWAKADTGTKSLIYDVSMADDQKGWAVGQLGLVMRTEDGGSTWAPQTSGKEDQGVQIFAVQAVDADRAWAIGEWGTRIYTQDGGLTWQDFSLTINEAHPQFVWLAPSEQEKVRAGDKVFEDVGLNDIYCLPSNRQHCWIIGEFGYVYRSENGGVDWERGEILSGIKLDPLALGFNVIAITPGQAEQVSEFAKLIADHQHLNVAIEPRVSEREIREFTKDGDPFPLFEIIEARTQEVQAAVEASGILSDRIRRRGAPPWDWEDFVEDDPEFLTRYLASRKADKPGIEVQIAQNPYLFTVRFADENQGYVSGLGGVVLRSEDGGRTWRYEDIGRKQALFSVEPFPDGRAVVVGEKGLMRVSSDSGKTWSESPGFPTLFTFMRDVAFEPSGKVGYIVGQRGLILRSEDQGKTWKQVLPKPKPVAVADASH